MRLSLLETARATGIDARRVRWIEARLDFDRRHLLVKFRDSTITSNAALLPTASWMTRLA